MIGQVSLLNKIDKLLDNFPTFLILSGPKGSGKKTIVNEICKKLQLTPITCGLKIDNVREVLDLAYTQTEKICYIFPDADDMSIGAKNSLLKVTEEPPNNAYFIMTLTSASNMIGTIKSRGTVLELDPYSEQELIQYRESKKYKATNDDVLKLVCTNTGEVDELMSCNVDEFYKFASTIVNFIHVPKTGNIFKISKQVKQKSSDNGYDGILLMKAIRALYIQKALETKDKRFLLASDVCSKILTDLQIPTLSKTATYDKWIMDVRQVLQGVQ